MDVHIIVSSVTNRCSLTGQAVLRLLTAISTIHCWASQPVADKNVLGQKFVKHTYRDEHCLDNLRVPTRLQECKSPTLHDCMKILSDRLRFRCDSHGLVLCDFFVGSIAVVNYTRICKHFQFKNNPIKNNSSRF